MLTGPHAGLGALEHYGKAAAHRRQHGRLCPHHVQLLRPRFWRPPGGLVTVHDPYNFHTWWTLCKLIHVWGHVFGGMHAVAHCIASRLHFYLEQPPGSDANLSPAMQSPRSSAPLVLSSSTRRTGRAPSLRGPPPRCAATSWAASSGSASPSPSPPPLVSALQPLLPCKFALTYRS